ncbi:MAG TPA: ChaN family lipoprotein [Pyrinomonadaceae bacterium]|nr:ChaN family lipoprotein [Pyrinomonadaceae bacterium]
MKLAAFGLFIVSLALLLTPVAALPQDAPQVSDNYHIYDGTGKTATLAQVVDAINSNEVVLIGETHNDQTAHLIERQLLEGAYARLAHDADKHNERRLALSLEMFERDVQTPLDEYLAGLITEPQFLASSRPWKNYQTDYRPLVEFARAHELTVVAANAPERYVNRVARLGRDSLKALSPDALAWLAPLPYPAASPAYAAKFKEAMGGGEMHGTHGNPYLLDAQVLRDATMAHSLAEQLRQQHALILHVTGIFHTEGRLGTPEQLRTYRPQTRVLVLTIAPASTNATDIKQLAGSGDFVFVTESGAAGNF